MSREHKIEYLPPKGTKYKWNPPSLQYSPISCVMECLAHPQSLTLYVGKYAQGYQGYLKFRSIGSNPDVETKTRYHKTALGACRVIERAGDKLLKADTRPWMKTALRLGWRPPF